jgi:hypothetical protein
MSLRFADSGEKPIFGFWGPSTHIQRKELGQAIWCRFMEIGDDSLGQACGVEGGYLPL